MKRKVTAVKWERSNTQITVSPRDTIFIELRELRIGFESNTFSDQDNNLIASDQYQSYVIRDVSPPELDSVYLAEGNAFIRIDISEGIYTGVNEFNNGCRKHYCL